MSGGSRTPTQGQALAPPCPVPPFASDPTISAKTTLSNTVGVLNYSLYETRLSFTQVPYSLTGIMMHKEPIMFQDWNQHFIIAKSSAPGWPCPAQAWTLH